MKKFILSVGLLVTASAAFAGPRVIGNGGDAVVCVDASGKKQVEILDYYEARVMRNINIDLGGPDMDVEDKVALALSRLNLVAPLRTHKYRQSVKEFSKRSMMVHDSDLQDIPDSQHVVIPQNCSVKQLVVQRQNAPADEPKFIINGDLWDLMDNTQRAGIILHEVIYSDALADGAENSIATRYFNSKISSGSLNFKTPAEVYEFFTKVGLKHIEINGMLVGRVELYEGGQFSTMALQKPHVFTVGRYRLTSDFVTFHENGTLSSTKAAERFIDFQNKTIELDPFRGLNIGFYDDGNVQYFHTLWDEEFEVQGKTVACTRDGSVNFHRNGSLSSCFVEKSFSGKAADGSKVRCSKFLGGPFTVYFNSEGLIDLKRDFMQSCSKAIF